VAPAEVEQELVAIDGVASAYVVAVDDQRRGQLVGAAVVLEEGATLDEAVVREIRQARLSTYKVPRLLVFVGADEVPVLPSMKVAKRDLAELIRSRAVDAAEQVPSDAVEDRANSTGVWSAGLWPESMSITVDARSSR
jgi:acyl-coenzyme A synthetase/AMP-(fatty) acid ligase